MNLLSEQKLKTSPVEIFKGKFEKSSGDTGSSIPRGPPLLRAAHTDPH